jgi:transcriptional regulator with XRE-family HTH domain
MEYSPAEENAANAALDQLSGAVVFRGGLLASGKRSGNDRGTGGRGLNCRSPGRLRGKQVTNGQRSGNDGAPARSLYGAAAMPSRDPMIAPRFIADQMAARGLKQESLAERLGTSQGYVSNVLNGVRPVALDDIERWADALELSPEARSLFQRYCIRSYGPPCANECVDALDNARAELAALGREVETLRTTVEVQGRYAESLERENATLRAERDALRRPSAG